MSTSNQDTIAASLVATLKQHIANIEAELANTRRELNAAKDTLRKLEQIIGKSEQATPAGETTAAPRPTPRIIEPIPPEAEGDVAPSTPPASSETTLPPAAQRVRNLTDKLLKRFGIDENA